MALHYYLGNSGAGKSNDLYEMVIREAALYPKRKYYILVPEQFTMATQREFVKRHPGHAILNIDVLSFKRLAYRVFEELGEDTLQILEDTGKNLILQKLAGQLEPQLSILQGNLHKIGYIDEIKSFITELTQYRIEPEQLEKMEQTEGISPLLQAKLSDIRLIYQAFLEQVRGEFLLAEEVVEHLAEIVHRSHIFADSVLVFDGYTGFTPVQQTFLREVFPMVLDIYVALTIDAREDLYRMDGVENLFYLSKKTIRMLNRIAEETGVEVEQPVMFDQGAKRRFVSAPLLYHLEQNLFRLGMKPYRSRDAQGQHSSLQSAEGNRQLQIISFSRPVDELRFAVGEIKRLVREEGFRYQEIAIVSGDEEGYSHYVPQVFSDYEIPYFLDQTTPILYDPLIECIRGLLELVERDFSYESVMRVMKTGLLSMEPARIDLLENYLLAYGIRGVSRWKKAFEKHPDWMSAGQLQELNEKREQLMELLLPYYETLSDKNSTVEENTRALYALIVSLKLREQQEDKRVYHTVMELLDKLVSLLGKDVIPLKEYIGVLEAGFEAAEVAVIPPGFDQVLIGDIERTRLEDIRVLFFLGVNDGIIPGNQNEGGILSQLEREVLANADYELAPTARERAFIQRFYLYLNMTKPSERLYLTCAKAGSDGAALRRSYLIGMLLRMFPGLTVQDGDALPPQEQIAAPGAAFCYLTEGLENAKNGKADRYWQVLFAWFGEQEIWKKRLDQLLRAAFYRYEPEQLSPDVSRMLYGTVLENSVTRLERFAACAYEHFLTYGLKLSEREMNTFEAVDFGNLVHTALEHYARKLAESKYNWFDVPENVRLTLGREAMETAMALSRNDALTASAKNRYLSTRMERLLHQTVDTLTRQVRKGHFQPSDYELGFGFADSLDIQEFALSEDEKMRLRGRIDRVDLLKKDQDIYVKIIDYKSGQTQFSLLSMYYGLQLQLVVYLNAARALLKRNQEKSGENGQILPAGIFYYHVDEPIVEAEGNMTEEEIWQSVFEKLKLDGIVNDDLEIIGAMDEQFTDRSDVIPVSRTKSGELSKTSKAYSAEQFELISDYVERTIKNLGKRMLQGGLEVSPYELKGKRACTFCGYRSICGFDEQLPGCSYRRLQNIRSEEEIFLAMEKEV